MRHLGRASLRAMKREAFVAAVPSKSNAQVLSKELNRVKSRGGNGADTSQTRLDRKAEFSRLGLHRMRMGVQPFMAARWQFH